MTGVPSRPQGVHPGTSCVCVYRLFCYFLTDLSGVELYQTDVWVELIEGKWRAVDYSGAGTVLAICDSKEEAFNIAEATYELSN